ncbi:MAG: hypothetical protein SOT64_02830 [Candidatus Faecousia sp.]|nr:hypothetical protein [Bacillota bacterium]MDY2809540.1 hypothetical protein [Candidatus Faecousia sp.]
MEKRNHLYVNRKNGLTWLMAVCMVGSAVARIALPGVKGTGEPQNVWSQILLPVAATLLYALIVLLDGKERFYKTAIPIWMLGLYFGISVTHYPFQSIQWIVVGLYWVAILFFCVLYTQITSGVVRHIWLLPLMFALPLGAMAYLHREVLTDGRPETDLVMLPDALAFFGCLLQCLALRVHPVDEYHPTWGDRTDGRRVRSLPPMAQVSPYIMVTRNTSTNYFTDSFELSHIERYVRQKRREGYTNFGVMHVLLAAYVRALARYPGLNRFLAGQKVYTHGDDVQFCMTIKKEMSSDSPDTVVKVHLSPKDTAMDVYNKVNVKIEEVKNTPLDSNFDNTAHVLTLIPGVFLKFTVWLLRTLDYFGMLPQFLLEVSPFHGSVFFTSMGSLGIPPIYHHLYDFGNLPVFGSFGCKRRSLEVQEDGTVVQKKYIDFKFCMDERIVDGFYYAAFFKHYKRIILHPEVLDNPPEEVVRDID